MKECPRCGRCADDAAERCPEDDDALQPGLPGAALLDGKYRLDRRLGQGGMGVIYCATHLALQRVFAVKLLRTERGASPAFLARFRVEAEALGKLAHPNVVDVTDFGVDPRGDGLAYLVMEYLEGCNLEELLVTRGPLEPERALPALEAMARAVDFAHERGILHRDLKPANVFLAGGRLSEVKILDFGLARLLGAGARTSDSTASDLGAEAWSSDEGETLDMVTGRNPTLAQAGPPHPDRLTEPGALAGTPAYMAPELFTGKDAARASDVYALGVVAYELLTGVPPFHGSLVQVFRSHRDRAPEPPSARRPSLPAELDRPVLAALEKDPARRPGSAREFVAALAQASHAAALRSWRARELPRRRWLAAAVALVALAGAQAFSESGPGGRLEGWADDRRFAASAARAPDPRLLLVVLDEASLEADATPLGERAAEVGQRLSRVLEAGAASVGVDLLLPRRFADSEEFSRFVLAGAPRLTLAAFSRGGATVGPECIARLTWAALGAERAGDLFGWVNLEPDADGVVRRGRLRFADGAGRPVGSWAARVARVAGASLPESGGRRFRIDHRADWSRLPRLSWRDLPARLDDEPGLFRGRVVLVGGDFVGSGDESYRLPAPAGSSSEVPGLLVQASLVETLLSGAPVREAGRLPLLAGVAAAAAGLAFALLCRPSPGPPLLAAAGILAAYLLAGALSFARLQLLLEVGPALSGLALAAGLGLALRALLPAVPRGASGGLFPEEAAR